MGRFLHPKLRCMHYLSDVNYPTDNLSQMDNLSLAWIQSLWWRHVMHLSKEDNPLPACRQINQYNYFEPYLWTDKQRGKRLWKAAIYPPPLHLTAFFTHTVCCLEIWIWRKQLERRRAHTCTAVKTYKPFSSRKGGSTVQVLNLYLWPFNTYLLRPRHIECVARREPSFNSDSTSKTDENSWWCQENPKSKSCSWLHESSWKQVEQFAKFIFTS